MLFFQKYFQFTQVGFATEHQNNVVIIKVCEDKWFVSMHSALFILKNEMRLNDFSRCFLAYIANVSFKN